MFNFIIKYTVCFRYGTYKNKEAYPKSFDLGKLYVGVH